MFLFKKIDVYGQVIAAFVCVSSPIFTRQNIMMMSFYFMVGAWQVVSTLLHLVFAKEMPLIIQRNNYQKTLLAIAVLGILFLFDKEDFGAVLSIALLFISPFLSVWYFILSNKELRNWEARELILFR